MAFNYSNPPRSRASGHKSRHVAQLSNIPLLGRTALISRIQQVASQTPDVRYPRLLAFLEFWKWLLPYLRDCIHTDAPYQSYPAGKTGIFSISNPSKGSALRIAVAADWGTGTLEAETIAGHIQGSEPHYTLHLGDVYYMGELEEVRENCLGKNTNHYTGVKWPIGSGGSFAVMGNHEMYSGGHAYFKTFLPILGLRDDEGVLIDPQSASYFCLETEHWLILGLDSGYHSGGVPFLSPIPGINKIPFLNVDARFDDKMVRWLQETMQRVQSQSTTSKSILLMTHHQPMSSFEQPYPKPVEQLAQMGCFDGQEVIWLYGHEHRFTVYTKQTIANVLNIYPRCIGHGGMPVSVTTLKTADPHVRYYDPGQHPIDKDHPGAQVGYNGHVQLLLEGPTLTIEYHDIIDSNLLLMETFTPGEGGILQHISSKPLNSRLRSGQEPNRD